MNDRDLVDYTKSLDCIHCGLCLNTCPTYRLTGAESSSPRGRVHLMRSVAEGTLVVDEEFTEEMDFCLLCRHCESVCPSGVRFGELMEHTRAGLESRRRRSVGSRLARWIGFRVILPHRFVLRTAAAVARAAQATGALAVAARVGGERGRALARAPRVPPGEERELLPASTAPDGPRAGVVGVLQGCVMPELLGRVNRATVEVLAAVGYESRVPPAHVCCGSLHAHNGDLAGARDLARRTIADFERALADAPESVVVVNSAGCGSHMKEYGHLLAQDPAWAERARRFAARVKDVSEFLASPANRGRLESRLQAARSAETTTGACRATWDDPCHLCHGQRIRREPRTLLDMVPALERVEMADAEACCGSAGIYSLSRPTDAAAVLEPKLESLRASGARLLVTGNPGCHLQWDAGVRAAGLDVRVAHVVEVLAEALRGESSSPS